MTAAAGFWYVDTMHKAFLLLAGCLVGLPSHAAQPIAKSPAPADWKVGVASIAITPKENLRMSGYAGRKKPAEGKAQDLFAKALALEDKSGRRMVIVTQDLIGVPQPLRKSLEQRVREKHQLSPEMLLLNASHTHSGPVIRTSEPPANPDAQYELERKYRFELEDKLLQVIGDALAGLAPAHLKYSHARAGFAMNRRRPTEKGYQNRPYADGPVDHNVPVLRVEGADGKLRAVLFGYACHNTCLGFYNYCGDYAGYAQEYFQAAHPGVSAHFLMGCGADQNPYPRGTNVVPGRTDLELAQQHGRTLATAVEAALLTNDRPVKGPLRSAFEEIDLAYASTKRPSHPYPVQVVQFGQDLTLVALGSEVVVDYSLRLKRELAGAAAVWVAGYSNDYTGYMPSLRVLKEGGYEAQAGWTEQVEERIVGKVQELYRQVNPKN